MSADRCVHSARRQVRALRCAVALARSEASAAEAELAAALQAAARWPSEAEKERDLERTGAHLQQELGAKQGALQQVRAEGTALQQRLDQANAQRRKLLAVGAGPGVVGGGDAGLRRARGGGGGAGGGSLHSNLPKSGEGRGRRCERPTRTSSQFASLCSGCRPLRHW